MGQEVSTISKESSWTPQDKNATKEQEEVTVTTDDTNDASNGNSSSSNNKDRSKDLTVISSANNEYTFDQVFK